MLRLLVDPPAGGAWNMAVDEALLETAAATGQATLRFYQWQQPTLSLGYFQSHADRAQHTTSCGCPIVRRASGGGAIIHDRELTYSLALPLAADGRMAATELYTICHQTLIRALAEYGILSELYRPAAECIATEAVRETQPFLCFQRRTCTDIVLSGAKIVGSAQRRRRGAVLQHGSVLLARSAAAPELPGIQDLAGVTIAATDLADSWTPHLGAGLKMSPSKSNLARDEIERAKKLSNERFSALEHLERR